MRAFVSTAALLSALFCIASTPSPAQAQGTHFFAEGGVGVMTGLSDGSTTDPGAATHLMIGGGGRPAGSWLRYYLVGEFLAGGYDRVHTQNLRDITLERRVIEVGLGLRIVAPLVPTVRFFADVEGVLLSTATDLVGTHLLESDSNELRGGLRLGTGVQFRPIELLSVNARVAMTTAFTEIEDDIGAGWLVGFGAEHGHYEGTLSVSVYF
jgi:hypothetical protein